MVTIRRILCPVDFSDFSQHALRRAVAIGREHQAAVTVLHVVPLRAVFTAMPLEMGAPVPMRLTDTELEVARRQLAAFADIEPPTDVRVDCELVEAATVHDEIVAQAARLNADLIVMGTHGRSGFQRWVFGSVAEKVLRQAQPPVLTVGMRADGGSGSFTRIVCGVDFSECSYAALDYALAIAGGAGAHVAVVSVLEWMPGGHDPRFGPPNDIAGYRLAAEAAASERLRKLIADLPPTSVAISQVVTSGKAHHALQRAARDQHADLIVIGIHGRNPIDRLFFGSTAEPVVRHAECPVLTVRPPAVARAVAAVRSAS
jgi:nucleotide-binding universal stress UspA family protein